MKTLQTDVAIIGGGLGGIAAALALLKRGYKVVMTEEYPWIGGQITSQGVPADQHRFINELGTRSYLDWQDRVRNYYRRNYPLKKEIADDPYFNPGAGTVSALCHEPKVSAAVFMEMLAPYISLGQMQLYTQTVPVACEVNGRDLSSVTVQSPESRYLIQAEYFLDATECGDLLPLSQTDYVTGAESKEDTGEWHAPEVADPLDMQAVTWCFAIARGKPGEDHTIEKPDRYEHYKAHLSEFWPGSQLSWTYSQPITLKPILSGIDGVEGTVNLWRYRQIFTKDHYDVDSDEVENITLVNWPQNDYWFGPLFEIDADQAAYHRNEAKEISRCWLYWLQTEAPRSDGGFGYPELKLRPDVMGTEDGFAQAPYIRESRRIHARTRITEADVGTEMRKAMIERGEIEKLEATQFEDTVGIGFYRIDLHPSTGGRNYIDIDCLPFQIPLGALIPTDRDNLLAVNKNIGTTHITNGCYRLHPVEWNIGESGGHLVAYCLTHNSKPEDVHRDESKLQSYQEELREAGIHLEWPPELRAGLNVKEDRFTIGK